MIYNIWDYYEKIIQTTLPCLNSKLQKNVISFTHAFTTIIWLTMYQLFGVNLILFTVCMSIGYYIHDLKNHTGNDGKSLIMYIHHVVSCILLLLVYLFESDDLSPAFLLVEISNLPLYITQTALYSPQRHLWEPYIKWCVLIEFISFFVFRCVGLLLVDLRPQMLIVQFLLFLVYLSSVMWTVKLGGQVLHYFIF